MAFPTQSVDFEKGSSQYASAADSASLSVTGDLTIETWLKIESNPNSATGDFSIASKWESATNNKSYWAIYFEQGGVYKLRMGASTDGVGETYATVNLAGALSLATWLHFAMVFTAATSTVEFFIDGVSVGSTTTWTSGSPTSLFNSSASFGVAARDFDSGGAADFYDGRMVLMRIWSAARTGTQINDNKCSTLGSTTNLQAEWTFDNVYTDNSGNSNTLTGVNTPTFGADIPATCAVVGPANLKTLDTNVKANIKTFDTNTLANMKTYNTNA